VDKIINDCISLSTLNFSYWYTYKDVDRGLIEKMGPSSVVLNIRNISQVFKKVHTGYMFHYLLALILSICFLYLIFVISLFLKLSNVCLIFFLFVIIFFFPHIVDRLKIYSRKH
jgi:hypothetical protein